MRASLPNTIYINLRFSSVIDFETNSITTAVKITASEVYMIITCPDCHTKYRTSAESIGPNGRTVRCANCATTWFVPSEEAELSFDKLALADIEREQSSAVQEEQHVTSQIKTGLTSQSKIKAAMAREGLKADDSEAVKSDWQGKTDTVESLRGAHSDMRARAEKKKARRRFWNVTMIWLIPLVLIGTAVFLAYAYRQDIVDKFPKSASLYKAVGVEVSAPGLTLTPPSTRYAEIDGKPVLIIEGTVRNISSEPKTIPLVALSLHNSSGEQLAAWNVEVEAARLEAGERAEYISQFPNPPIDAQGLQSRFADELEITRTPLEILAPQTEAKP